MCEVAHNLYFMIDVNIGLNSYRLPLYWDNITLQEGIELHALCSKSIPKKLSEKYDIILNIKSRADQVAELELWAKDVSEDYTEDQLPRFVKALLNFWSIPYEVTDKCTNESLIQIFVDYIELFVIGILNNGVGYHPLGIDGFKIDNKPVLFPEPKQIGENTIPMYNLTTIQFCECADLINLINTQGFHLMPFFVSTLLQDGVYDEDVVLDNAKLFLNAPMNYVWESVAKFNVFNDYVVNRFTNVFKSGGSKSGVKLSNSWRKFIIDIHTKSNYLYELSAIENSRILHTLEVSDRESEVIEYQNKLNEEHLKKSKK